MFNGADSIGDASPRQKAPNAAELLQQTKIEVAPAFYRLIGLRSEEWRRLLENPELSPRGSASYMVLRDEREVTLLVDDADWETMRYALRDAQVENGFRLVTLNITLGWNVVGYIAAVTAILAEAGIPVGVLSAFSCDHLLIKQEDLSQALRVLGKHVGELR